ncbi:protein required for protein sorting at the late Golgi [Scheffersomyces xylosifermentans]|uniref:protein required for protein sorting at the late Golgi n=1 Tax=Scheffersomyces xylosifermentans TaxID=1304137 RepID=UPI00315DCE4F
MNSHDYTPNDHLHQIFTSPQSLNELPQLLSYTSSYKHQLGKDITKDIESYDSSCPVGLNEDIVSLISLIRKVKSDSHVTQNSISSMTGSIRDLDQYKKNLVLSMTILKRLQMLINANNTLISIMPSHNYKEILSLFSVIKELLIFFQPYKAIDEINQLNLMVIGTQNKLIDDIFIDFEDFSAHRMDRADQLVYGCEILELIDVKYKEKLLQWFENLQLKDIKAIFNSVEEAGSLDNLNRRYIYFNNTLKSVRGQYLDIFPKDWQIDLKLTQLFCTITKKDLINLLGSTNVKSNTLLDNLMATLDFEKALNETFKTTEFTQIISSVFEPYLLIWINEQDKVLSQKFSEFMAAPQLPSEFNEKDDFLTVLKVNNVPNIANSSTELFKNFQKILTSILKLSNGEILIELSKLFIKYLYDFHNKILAPMIPKNDDDLGGGLEPLKYLTMLLNTGDYMINNIDDLADKFKSLIKDQYESKLPTYENIKDVYFKLINKSISNLLIKISNDLKFSWRQFMNANWSNMDAINDVSSYMLELKKQLASNLSIILPLIIRESYIRNFNDKLVELLITSLSNNLKFIKPLNVTALEQILLDVSFLKEVSLKFPLYADPNYDEAKSTNASSVSYQKFVNNQFHGLESLLKLLMAPHLPIENIIESYFELIGDKSIRNFMKILNLKDINKSDQTRYIENFKLQLTLDDGTLTNQSSLLSNLEDEEEVMSASVSQVSTPTPDLRSPKLIPAKINNFEKNLRDFALTGENHVSKLNENFKNFGKFFRKDND